MAQFQIRIDVVRRAEVRRIVLTTVGGERNPGTWSLMTSTTSSSSGKRFSMMSGPRVGPEFPGPPGNKFYDVSPHANGENDFQPRTRFLPNIFVLPPTDYSRHAVRSRMNSRDVHSKLIPASPFVVDGFKVISCSEVQRKKHVFVLTHFHADHYTGLDDAWNHGPVSLPSNHPWQMNNNH